MCIVYYCYNQQQIIEKISEYYMMTGFTFIISVCCVKFYPQNRIKCLFKKENIWIIFNQVD